MRNIFDEYLAGNPEVLDFFAGAPQDLFTKAPHPGALDEGLVQAIQEYQARLGGQPPVLSCGDAVVVTGQQPALFAGPLYTIYKAVTVIRLARKIEAAFRVRCVPVFWLAADDHDFEEARTAHFLSRTHEPFAATYAPEETVQGRSMYFVPLEDTLHRLVNEVGDKTAGSEFKEGVVAFLHDALSCSASLADWSGRILARLFQGTGLTLFAPHIPAARELAREALEPEIAEPLRNTRLINETGMRLEKLGFARQLAKSDNECNFFLQMGGRRRKVLFEKNRFHLPEEGIECSVEDMLALLRTSPERFSPNVALRCIVQQRLFSPAAYVAGPGEVAYWAQFKPVFERYGCAMPVVYPRARAVLTTLKLNKLRQHYGFGLDDLAAGRDILVQRALRHIARDPARETLARRRDEVQRALRRLTEDLKEQNLQAASMAQGLERRIEAGLDRLDRALILGDAAKRTAVEKHVARLCNELMPFRKPQERVYTVFAFLFEYGWDLIPRLLQALDIESFRTHEVEL